MPKFATALRESDQRLLGHPAERRARRTKLQSSHGRMLAVAIAWAVATVAAFAVTLPSVSGATEISLQFVVQIPLALPWAFVAYSNNHVVEVWILGGLGLLNSALLVLAARMLRNRSRSS